MVDFGTKSFRYFSTLASKQITVVAILGRSHLRQKTVLLQKVSDDNGESDDNEIPVKRILLAKTGATWQETPFRSNVRRSAKNIITTQTGPIGAAKNAKTLLGIFSFFMTPAVIAKITDHTNQKIKKIKDRYSSTYDVTATTTSEILAMLGILVIAGAQQASRHDIADLRKSDRTGMDLLRSVMTY